MTQRDFIDAYNDCGTWMQEYIREAVQHGSDLFTESAELAGWYYWYCFPGCMPDSNPFGPYPTEAEALHAAQHEE
jgi:hypothetical protein